MRRLGPHGGGVEGM
uniref:Uncharacterized protein n=1 Tax=Brassica napus TaxID=3708 RepID=I7DAG4_BRANA|nr:hypothetical protein [Brassica napus]